MSQIIDLRKKKNKTKVKKTKPSTNQSQINKIEWTAPEFTKYNKEKSWFVLPGIIALIIIILAIILKNFLLVIGTILAVFALYVYAFKEPKNIKFTISGRGIQIDQDLFRFSDLKSFWVFYEPPDVKEISIHSKKMLMPYIKIPIADQNPVKIRELLLKFLPERKHVESITDKLMRKIRF